LDEVHLSSNLTIKNGRPPFDPDQLQDTLVMSASSEVAVILLIFACGHKGLPLYRELADPLADRNLKWTSSSIVGYKVSDECECSIRHGPLVSRMKQRKVAGAWEIAPTLFWIIA
jgi:hypothetical protein